MPTPVTRPSLTTDLQTRYANQREGGAFDVKVTLGPPGSSPKAGTTIDASSMNAVQFQSPRGFEVRVMQGITQFLDAQSAPSKQLSTYIKGFNNQKYHP